MQIKPKPQPVMPLSKALTILMDVHTKDDAATGFSVQIHPAHPATHTEWGITDYIRAWASVRAYMSRRYEP